jgi:hypothetical protein
MAPTDTGPIESSIIVIREQRVILAADLAYIYGVETRALNQAVKRNIEKFPHDFMFRLTRTEVQEIAASRSQSVILKRGQNIKYLPYAFTEHGAIMAANVLNSPRAVQMSVFVVRAFVRLRQMIITHKELAAKLRELERKVSEHDGDIRSLFQAIRQLMTPAEPNKRKIGFLVKDRAAGYGKR